jgi:2-polyprenyl-3-methyl-5-hydroxy-6-metoxy-1,4-benzoquinol methylase
VYVNPMYTNIEKDKYSPVQRLLHRSRSAEQGRGVAFQHSLERMQRCMALLGNHLQRGDDVLEIGSGDGAMLWLLKQAGANPFGLDMDQESALSVQREFDIPVLAGTFEDSDFGQRRFDAIVLVHLIEHFFEPVQMLRKIRGLLKPGGIVFLETPNIFRPKVGPGRVFSFAHNYHFSPRTLALALHQAGLRPTALRVFRRDSFQMVATRVNVAELGHAPAGDSWARVARKIREYRLQYFLSLQFLYRKLPWLKRRLIYGVHRDLDSRQLTCHASPP